MSIVDILPWGALAAIIAAIVGLLKFLSGTIPVVPSVYRDLQNQIDIERGKRRKLEDDLILKIRELEQDHDKRILAMIAQYEEKLIGLRSLLDGAYTRIRELERKNGT